MANESQRDPLAALATEQLSSVTFVQDYLQLGFDGRGLTLNVWPIVVTGTARVRHNDYGYCDALCSFIGKTVERVVETESRIDVLFVGGDSIQIDLLGTEEEEGNRVIYQDSDKNVWAWW